VIDKHFIGSDFNKFLREEGVVEWLTPFVLVKLKTRISPQIN
jgi:hypothetical protein